MIKVKEFFETRDCSVDKHINDFLEENPQIQFIDIKYCTFSGNCTDRSCALLIYKEII